ncbi:hypothetical protein SEA_AMORE2_24 [Gordonia phage Amore2]|uniref:Uncharacterized protein n=1 Tax=Gordonia phage GTE7 TaxID=1100814 RepID=G8FS08_9CAUD|nr:neck protein [Gordonia phage GTE7]AER26558.1 hypothetical protein [Gordonia phage GTE7]QSL99666.1 hypothetical protein SEA_AUSTIN_24 [Gordonia phage Austin]USH44840.1 hypothetical protein SEA_AMORE2_24 [Gordonia phage Amore2]
MPSQEELQAKRDELAALQKSNAEKQAEKDGEAAEARRQADYDRLEQEIAYAKQAQEILGSTPPDNSAGNTSATPPDNANVPPVTPPSVPNFNLGNDENEEN